MSELIRDRLLLFSIIIFVWLFCEILELLLPERILSVFPGPFQLVLLFFLITVMSVYLALIFLLHKKNINKIKNKNINLIENKNIQEKSVDIFIPAHNEEAVILETIKHALSINYNNYKIWIIDDRSLDKTSEKIQEFIENNKNNNFINNKLILVTRTLDQPAGKAASLNQCLKLSTADYILVCDADARLSKECLNLAIPYFTENKKLGAVQFQKKISNFNYNILTICQDFEMAFDTYLQFGRDKLRGLVELRGSGQIASRECLLDIGGWDEKTLTDDLEISTRMHTKGWKIKIAPEIEIYEEAVITLKSLIKQRKRWAEGSLRRYLTHFKSFISPKSKITLWEKLDIIPIVLQFGVPIWIFLDIISQVLNLIFNKQTYIPLLTLAIISTSLIILINIIISIRFWRSEYSLFESIKYGILTFFYGAFHWPTIVLWTMRKVLFSRSSGTWVKTPRMSENN